MKPGRRKWWFLLVAVLIGGISSYAPARTAFVAVRYVLDLRKLATGATQEDVPVNRETVLRQRGARRLEALVYTPANGTPDRAILLAAGISELGCYHPRLVAVSRSLANRGFLVITPDILMFRDFQIAPEAMDEIAFWFEQVKSLRGGDRIRRVGLGGISFSGTLALIVAARPEIRQRVAYVLAIGPYDDPLRCAKGWFEAGPITVGIGYYPTRFYAKWIIMNAALGMLPNHEERRFIQSVLIALLLQKGVPEPPNGLSAETRRWYRLAVMRENESDEELTRSIEEYLTPRLYLPITPDRAAPEVHCPVFLVHGAYDDLIPPEQSQSLRARLTHTESFLLISPFLTHTHPLERRLGWREQAAGILDILGFFYRFAQVTSGTAPNSPFHYN